LHNFAGPVDEVVCNCYLVRCGVLAERSKSWSVSQVISYLDRNDPVKTRVCRTYRSYIPFTTAAVLDHFWVINIW